MYDVCCICARVHVCKPPQPDVLCTYARTFHVQTELFFQQVFEAVSGFFWKKHGRRDPEDRAKHSLRLAQPLYGRLLVVFMAFLLVKSRMHSVSC